MSAACYTLLPAVPANGVVMQAKGLPAPGSAELEALVPNRTSRKIYDLLVSGEPLTIDDVKARIDADSSRQMHLDRRLRALDDVFDIERVKREGKTAYKLIARRQVPAGDAGRISQTLRAQILALANGRCQMCGRTIADDGITLVIDHRIPRRWGGMTEINNLWAICATCNQGKKAYFASLDEHAEEIRAAIAHDEVHRRLGELFRAFGRNKEVPSDLLALVASAGRYQDDWQRRLRELRELGWDYKVAKRKEEGRFRSFYVLLKEAPWPKDIRKALKSS